MAKRPFAAEPDPDLFFVSSVHEAGQEFLRNALDRGERFVMLTGELGTGKTILATTLAKRIDLAGNPHRVYLPTPLGDYPEVLRRVVSATGSDSSDNTLTTGMLESRLLRYFESADASPLVLILDEAQSYTGETLERLRLLVDAIAAGPASLRLVLVGMTSLNARLAETDRLALGDRVQERFELSPLSYPETREYIYCRLVKSGASGRPVFPEDAITSVQILTNGVPRRINAICEACLEMAASRGVDHVTMDIVQAAGQQKGYARQASTVEDAETGPQTPSNPPGIQVRASTPANASQAPYQVSQFPPAPPSEEELSERSTSRFDWTTWLWRGTVVVLTSALIAVLFLRDVNISGLLQ